MQVTEPCWKCGSLPEMEKTSNYLGEVRFRYTCPQCKHKSTSSRKTKDKALTVWNSASKMFNTKAAKKAKKERERIYP